MAQSSFFCPNCRTQKLFTADEMNHTPHILASVFLCGLWLPIWLLTAVFYKSYYHCSQCGFADEDRYLRDPNLRAAETEYRALQPPSAFGEWTKNPANNWKIIAGVFGIVIAVVLVALTADQTNRKKAVAPEPVPVVSAYKEPTSAEILRDAKSYIQNNKGKMTDSGYYALYFELRKISRTAPEYAEAQKILTQYKKQIDAADKNLK